MIVREKIVRLFSLVGSLPGRTMAALSLVLVGSILRGSYAFCGVISTACKSANRIFSACL